MKKFQRLLSSVLAFLALAVLILDSKTALAGATDGIRLCIQTLIPSLFPFLIASTAMTASLAGRSVGIFRPLTKLLRIPAGAEALMAAGLLGGYPAGAQALAQARKNGLISQWDAKRMLAFCSNAGPAFLFGIGARIFPEARICWLLWGIHIISAWIVALLTPGTACDTFHQPRAADAGLPAALKKSVWTMALICGWVLLFRILLSFAQRWFLWLIPMEYQLLFTGLMELANGCCGLSALSNTGTKLALFAVFISFGGLCVMLQTYSVAENIDKSMYLPGKLTQAAVSFLLSLPAQYLLPRCERMPFSPPAAALCALICASYWFFHRKKQKNSSNPRLLRV